MDNSMTEGAYNTAAYSAAGSAMMSFKPINGIHQHICGFHMYAYVSLDYPYRSLLDRDTEELTIRGI